MDVVDGTFKLPSIPEPKEPKHTVAADDLALDKTETSTKTVAVRQGETIQLNTPEWCTIPPANQYTFSVIKNGAVVDEIKLDGKARFLVGRKSEESSVACDIPAEHPSCSRNHAVLFYGEKPADNGASFYLVDLNSAHGTFVNKMKLVPGTFYRLDCGFVLKFGASTRILVLEGPPSSAESLEDEVAGDVKVRNSPGNNSTQQNSRDTSGMNDAADEGFARRSAKRQRAVAAVNQSSSTKNEDDADIVDEHQDTEEQEQLITDPIELEERAAYYRDDPKAILTKWFDVMGYELEITTDEHNAGTKAAKYSASVELPYETFDGIPLVGRAISVRKKEAIHQACLDACRLLDMRRALRETIQNGPIGGGESERMRKAKRLAANDYYDDEEDAFFDRTDELQLKRMRRMQRDAEAASGANAAAAAKAETFDSLQTKLAEAEQEIAELAAKLEQDSQLSKPKKATNETEDSSTSTVDALDAFIDGLRQGILLDPKEKSKAKQRLVALRAERTKLEALVEIARPSIPLLAKVHLTSAPVSANDATSADTKVSGSIDAEISNTAVQTVCDTLSAPKVVEKSMPPKKQVNIAFSTRAAAKVFDGAESGAKKSASESHAPPVDSTSAGRSSNGNFMQRHKQGGKIQAPLPEPGSMRAAEQNDATKKRKVHSITTRIMQAAGGASDPSNSGGGEHEHDNKYDMWIPPENAEKTSL